MGLTDWAASSRDPLLSASVAPRLQTHGTKPGFSVWVLGLELRFSCLHDKRFANCPASLAPNGSSKEEPAEGGGRGIPRRSPNFKGTAFMGHRDLASELVEDSITFDPPPYYLSLLFSTSNPKISPLRQPL